MQLRTIVLSGNCASAMLATPGVSAVQQTDQKQKQTQQNERNKEQAGQVARLSQLVKANAETPQGEALGKVEDFAVHRPSGQAVYAIISTNGIRGLNNERKAVPFEALKINRGQGPVQIDTTLDRFRDAPKFSSEGWTTIGDARWGKIVHQHYGVEFDPSDLTRTDDDDQAPSQISMVQATRMLDMDLENRQGQDLGDV